MAFWGIEVKPGKPYIYMHFGERGRLRISQAILGAGTRSSSERSIVECHVENKDPVYICSLEPERTETCPLNLEFDEYNLVMFKVIGPCSVHLSGFFFGESKNTFTIISEDETNSNGSNGYDTEDKQGDGVIDDDLDMFPSSPVADDGVTKETPNDEKPSNKNGISKQPKKKNQLSASYNGNSQRQNVVKSGTGVPVLESEDEDGFPISSPHQSNADVLIAEGKEAEVEDSKTNEEAEQKKVKDDTCSLKSLKRKVNAIVQNGEEARKTVQLVDSSLATTEEVAENNKRKKKNKKKKLEGQEEKTFEAGTGTRSCTQTEEATTLDIDQALPSGKEHDEKLTTHKSIDVDADSTAEENHSEKKKKKKGKSKKQESGVNANMEQTITDENRSTMEIEERTEAKPFQVRTFSNGLIIEELAMGKPDGKRASPGKKVGVHYIGKLKKNGKIFDSNVGKAPFKFRLGVGQVIKGWDVGVNGMRVGDKRRLTIPPAMGYGAQGAGGAIPPNSWLLFDVELVDVR